MWKGDERPEERTACRVVERVEGVELRFRDDGTAPPGMHDYDLLRSGRVVGALEVTTLMDESRQALSQAIARRSVIPAPEVDRDWYVNLQHEAEGYSVREVGSRIVSAIVDLEQRGLYGFNARPRRRCEAEPLAIEQLPVRFAMSFEREHDGEEGTPARVVLMPPAIAGTVISRLPRCGSSGSILRTLASGRFLRMPEVAADLRVSRRRVQQMYAEGKLPEPERVDGLGPTWKPATIGTCGHDHVESVLLQMKWIRPDEARCS